MPPVNPKRPRGRPRSESARAAILAAAARLVESGGIGAVTMEAVARAAGVGKPTVYRNFPSREALAMAAVLDGGAPNTKVRDSGTPLQDLHRQLLKVAKAFATPRGRNAALMVASADPDSELSKAFRNQVMLASREEGRILLARAQATGDLRPDLDADVALDLVYGPVFYRLLVGHAPANEAFVEGLLAVALAGMRR